MDPGDFIFNGVHSNTLANSKIQLRPEIAAPVRKGVFTSVPGVSGDYILDENAYANTSVTLELICDIDDEDDAMSTRAMISKTFNTGGYAPLELYFDPDWIYYAKTTSGPTFRVSGEWPTILLYSVELSLKPFKESSNMINTIKVSSNETRVFLNPNEYSFLPLITVVPEAGDEVILSIENSTSKKQWGFRNVDDFVKVDSSIQEVYKDSAGISNRNYTMTNTEMIFPFFEPGRSTIELEGRTLSYINISGRWRTLVC